MEHLWVFMELGANAVTAKLAHDGEPLLFSKHLNGVAHIAQTGTGFDLHDAVPHGVVGHRAQALGGNRRFTDQVHAAGVAVPAVFDHGDVDVDNVSFFQPLVIWNAVAHLVVDRRAQRLRVGGIA